ncbi:MAG TPA: hypothetical protein VEW46_17775 [Pyrinomonadaceae bacterium]|nr:hypothetical protein [Pyrinomonadaceae bacterium]
MNQPLNEWSQQMDDIHKIVSRVGQTDAQVNTVKTQLEGVVDKAIVRSRSVDRDAVKETIEVTIKSYLADIPFGQKVTVAQIVSDFSNYSPAMISRILFDLSTEGKIKFDDQVKTWRDIYPALRFEPNL